MCQWLQDPGPHSTSSSAAVATTALPSSGYHIPRGAAAVANMTASRSQNFASIVRTTSQIIASPSTTTLTTPRTSIISQRMVPISSSNWINRNPSATVLSSKTTGSPGGGRISAPGRSSQSTVVPVTTYGGTVKPGSVVAGAIRSQVPSAVRVGMGSDSHKSISKGIHVPHSVPHTQKYIGSGSSAAVRGVGTSTFISPGSTCTSLGSNTVYTPTSTLVTSLASSGTTITPHPGNKSQAPNTVRLTSAVTTVFTQASTQANSSSLGGICFTASSTGTIITHHPTTLTRAHSVEHLSVKSPLLRASHSSSQLPGNKASTPGLPGGTHISLSGPKVIAQSSQVPTLALAQLTNVTGSKPPGTVITTQATLNTPPFQSRTGTIVTPPMSRGGGPTISMTKVIPQVKGTTSQGLTTSLTTITAAPSQINSVAGSNVTPDCQSPHSSVFVHRTLPAAPTTGSSVSQSERSGSTVSHYNIGTPYYLDSNQTFPISASIVSTNHYIPTTMGSGSSVRVGGNNVSNSPVSANEGNSHQGMSVPIIKPNTSPRPSILRKRSDLESGVPLKAAKNLSAALNIPLTSPPSPIRPDSRGNGNISSGSTTVSANSSPGSGGKSEAQSNENLPPAPCLISFPVNSRPQATISNDTVVNTSSMERGVLCTQNSVPLSLSSAQVIEGVSPRKKPRKQQLMGNELQEIKSEDDFENPILKKVYKESQERRIVPPVESEEEKDQNIEPVSVKPESWRESTTSPEPALKRPHMSLMNSYKQNWKSRHNHFHRHSDVRPKEEKKRTVNEIANQKLAMQRVMHLSGQVEDLMEMESDVVKRLKVILGAIEKRQQQKKPYKDFEKDVNRLSELVKANIQRSVITKDQIAEAKVQMMNIFNHKDNITNILTKYGNNKRSLRKKDRI
ncbi:Histone deacetylase complex subunit [Armadillidium nasatum]|uniref:Histone deacetylase complex subunit n=1 Tax=Armadillidium nasatum TaxID=96803 RepID=A0A5N5TJC1_9CRUS|nr:Histone deacetylase complex subunit [Armadillidium nasatum]